jgi:hypothetical protein
MSQNRCWEMGGEFHWSGLPDGPRIPWPQPRTWFALGHAAGLAIWHQHSSRSPKTSLWVPDYFCPEVMGAWREAGVRVRYYSDDPRWPYPDWDSLSPNSADLVLAVNYFGVRTGSAWQAWHRGHKDIVLMEDHSHDPLSDWVLNSKADYAFASLRKTFFAPDGAFLWSPRGHPLPPEPRNRNWSGSALKLAAMIWKSEYLAGCEQGPVVKDTFRGFQVEGEKMLFKGRDSSISPWSRALLEAGCPIRWRQQREGNVRLFLELVGGENGIEPLFVDWPAEHCPFNAVLIFSSHKHREVVRSGLIAANVYPSIHWMPMPDASTRSLDLSRRILTIPLDQRYGSQDVHCLASIFTDIAQGRARE